MCSYHRYWENKQSGKLDVQHVTSQLHPYLDQVKLEKSLVNRNSCNNLCTRVHTDQVNDHRKVAIHVVKVSLCGNGLASLHTMCVWLTPSGWLKGTWCRLLSFPSVVSKVPIRLANSWRDHIQLGQGIEPLMGIIILSSFPEGTACHEHELSTMTSSSERSFIKFQPS